MTLAPDASPSAPSQLAAATLQAVAGLTGMRVAFLSAVEGPALCWQHVHGRIDGLVAGTSVALTDTFCGRMLDGATGWTRDAGADPDYATTPLRSALGITAYAGVPLRCGGVVVGTLGAMDTEPVAVGTAQLKLLSALARTLAGEAAADPEVRLHRTASGWEVESQDGARQSESDLTVAMSLADLVAGDAARTVPAQRPQRPFDGLSEAEQLRVQVGQLEHALSARVVIEQAIGVLAERFRLAPRDAFDRMRRSARSRGQRVHDLAGDIVQSARDESVALPAELG